MEKVVVRCLRFSVISEVTLIMVVVVFVHTHWNTPIGPGSLLEKVFSLPRQARVLWLGTYDSGGGSERITQIIFSCLLDLSVNCYSS